MSGERESQGIDFNVEPVEDLSGLIDQVLQMRVDEISEVIDRIHSTGSMKPSFVEGWVTGAKQQLELLVTPGQVAEGPWLPVLVLKPTAIRTKHLVQDEKEYIEHIIMPEIDTLFSGLGVHTVSGGVRNDFGSRELANLDWTMFQHVPVKISERMTPAMRWGTAVDLIGEEEAQSGFFVDNDKDYSTDALILPTDMEGVYMSIIDTVVTNPEEHHKFISPNLLVNVDLQIHGSRLMKSRSEPDIS